MHGSSWQHFNVSLAQHRRRHEQRSSSWAGWTSYEPFDPAVVSRHSNHRKDIHDINQKASPQGSFNQRVKKAPGDLNSGYMRRRLRHQPLDRFHECQRKHPTRTSSSSESLPRLERRPLTRNEPKDSRRGSLFSLRSPLSCSGAQRHLLGTGEDLFADRKDIPQKAESALDDWSHITNQNLLDGHEESASRKRRNMKTVSKDDYLMGRGANPRTGVVTPGWNNSVSDETGLLQQRGISSSKWRMKGDQWISLGLDEPTPLPTPPAELRESLNKHDTHSHPSISAIRVSPFRHADHGRRPRQRPANGTAMPGTLPETPQETPPAKIEQQPSPPKPDTGVSVPRKAIGSPTKAAATLQNGDRDASTETVITKPKQSVVQATEHPRPAVKEYFSPDDVGRDLPAAPPDLPPRRDDQNNSRKVDKSQQKPFLGMRKGDWVEDVPAGILDTKSPGNMASGRPMNNIPYPPNPSRMNGQIYYGRPQPRPIMGNMYENRSLLFQKGMPAMNEPIPHIPSSRSWTAPPRGFRLGPNGYNHSRPRAGNGPSPYVNHHHLPNPGHQGMYPAPPSGMVRDMRQRMEISSGDIRQHNETHQTPFNASRIITPTSIPTTTETPMKHPAQEAVNRELSMLRQRPLGMSRPAPPQRSEGNVSVPQCTPKQEGQKQMEDMTRDANQSGQQGDSVPQGKKEGENSIPQLVRPSITVTSASPERITMPVGNRDSRCLHHQMGLQPRGPAICHCTLDDPKKSRFDEHDMHGFTHMPERSGQDQALDGNVEKITSGGGLASLAPSPDIGTNVQLSHRPFGNHSLCCPDCCASGCHGGCLGHASPDTEPKSMNFGTGMRGASQGNGMAGFGIAVRSALRNTVRLRKSGPSKGNRRISGDRDSDSEEEEVASFASLWACFGKSPSNLHPGLSNARAGLATKPGKRILSDSSIVSDVSVLSAVNLRNMDIGSAMAALSSPIATVAEYLDANPQVLSLGRGLMVKIIEMLHQVLYTVSLVWNWWWYYQINSNRKRGKRHAKRPGAEAMVNLAKEVFRALVNVFILSALGVMSLRILGVVLGCFEWVFWVGRTIGWVCSGFGILA